MQRHKAQPGLEGKRVLEIGCGIALSSLVLHKMGIDVTASDYHPLANEFLDENVLGNDMLPIKFQGGNWEAENPLLGEFDLIIGSDLLYEREHVELLSGFIDQHAKANCAVIIVDPGRGHHAQFSKNMVRRGYSHSQGKPENIGYLDHPFHGQILRYQRM